MRKEWKRTIVMVDVIMIGDEVVLSNKKELKYNSFLKYSYMIFSRS